MFNWWDHKMDVFLNQFSDFLRNQWNLKYKISINQLIENPKYIEEDTLIITLFTTL